MVSRKISRAEKAISEAGVMEVLREFSPTIVSTIFVGFDTDLSDIDVVCEYQQRPAFAAAILSNFQNFDSFTLKESTSCVVGSFSAAEFCIEVYGAPVPVAQQSAFRHFQVMQRLALVGGPAIKEKVRMLKKTGLKTEPAISQVLRLEGDPYTAVLDLELWSDARLESHVQRYI